MEALMGTITCFGGNFAPRNWAFCNGQLLPINQNQALFSILGTTYGGNGTTTFALPDLRGRTPVSTGQGPGLSNYDLGLKTGQESVNLTVNNIPSHAHSGQVTLSLNADSNDPTETNPDFAFPAKYANAYGTTSNGSMQPPNYSAAISNVGNNIPVPVLMPYTSITFIICLFGIFPSRN